MNRDDVASVVFVCGGCGVRIRVDDAMRETLIEDGCPLCDGGVSSADFERLD